MAMMSLEPAINMINGNVEVIKNENKNSSKYNFDCYCF